MTLCLFINSWHRASISASVRGRLESAAGVWGAALEVAKGWAGRGLCPSVAIVECGGGRHRIRNDGLVVCDPVGGNSGTI